MKGYNMSFEYLVEKENTIKKLSKTDENSIVKSITEDFKIYNEKRVQNLQNSNALIDEIFFKNKKLTNSSDKNTNWKSKIKMCRNVIIRRNLWIMQM